MGNATDTRQSDIAVIGMACRFPHAKDLNALWKVISTGEVTFEPIPDTRWTHSSFVETQDLRAPDKTYVQKGAFVDGVEDFAALHYGLAPRRVQVMDPQHRLAIEATRQALQDAGYDAKPFDRAHTGVYIGASVSEYKDLMSSRHRALQMVQGDYGDALSPAEAEALKASVADVAPVRTFSIAGSLLNMIACSVAQTFDLNGPAMSIDAACSSALVAIHEAAVNLRARQINLALAGGVYLNITPDNLVGFSRIGAISPTGACRPFDAKADGFVMGEGVGLVVLKRLLDAQRDGDRVYAVLRGSGCNNDGRGEGPMTPRPEGQRDAMRRAHAEVDFPVETIGYVETHGTATTVGDVVEVGALKHFFAERAGHALAEPYCWLGSIKANIGHTMSAAGVAGFMKTCLVLHHAQIPPQPAVEELNPKLDLPRSPFKVPQELTAWPRPAKHPRRAAVSSFGFGGTNAHVLVEEAPERAVVAAEQEELFVLSAPLPELLARYARDVADTVEQRALAPADVAATLASRAAFDARLAFVAKGRAQLVSTLRACADGLAAGQLPAGAVYAPVPLPADQRRVAFLFPGQGAQRVGLLKDLVDRFPALKARLLEYDAAARADMGCSLLDALYPPAPYDTAKAQAHLTRTEVCQPAMAALGLALGEFLKALHLAPDVTLGHSLGEFVAAAAAEMLTPGDAVRLVAQRGQLMNGLGLEDPGAMLAVMADEGTVARHLPVDGVVVANHNHPQQLVLSGTTRGIEAAEAKLKAAGLKVTRLEVSHAFHSPLMAGIDAGMRAKVAALAVHEAKVPVASCIAGRVYASAADAREVWVRHATAPVRFVEGLRACADAGATQFVQVGGGSSLLSFARGAANGPGAGFYALSPADGGDHGAQFLATLGQLWVKGAPLALAPLFPRATLATLPPTPLETQRYWAVERAQRAPHRPLVPADSARAAAAGPAASSSKGVVMDNLVALFQQQMALLQSQAEILRAQAAAIQSMATGQAVELPAMPVVAAPQAAAPATGIQPVKLPDFSNLVTPPQSRSAGEGAGGGVSQPAPAPLTRPAADLSPLSQGEVQARVFSSVARISAFPIATLKREQTLVGELGFDSLMLVELDGDVGKAFPALGGLPRELFSRTTTVGQVVDHLVRALEQGGTVQAEPAQASVPVQRYAPTVAPAPLHAVTESVVHFNGPLLLTRDAHGIADALAAKLKGHGLAAQVGDASTAGDFAGVIHLADVDASGDFRAPARTLLALAKRLGAEKAEAFVAVTGLGGGFGLAGASRELLGQTGALGFVKALSQEWPDALVKGVDVEVSLGADAIAQRLVEELLSGDRTAEVGLTRAGRVAVAMRPLTRPAADLSPLKQGEVVVVTGGAKGLGLKFAKALAKSGAVVALAGRTAPTEEIARATAQVKAAGARACTYHVVDVRDAASVRAAVDAVRTAHGRVDAVVHAAGVLADALVGTKDAAQLDAVLDTKVAGALALLDATAGDALRLFVGVGSWAGRFGNAAQTDYSAANEMLARVATLGRKGLRAVTIDFPPWEDSEMARKIPGFKKAELKAAGVTFLSDDEGVAAFLAEAAAGEGEVLVGRAVPERTVEHKSHFPVSRLNHVYLNDHTMAGQRVLPFAAALDHAVAAALDATTSPSESGERSAAGRVRGASTPFTAFTVTDFKLKRAVLVPDTTWLEVAVKQRVRGGVSGALDVTLSQGRAVSYAGVVSPGADAAGLPQPKAFAPTPRLPLSLEDFYQRYTFHGPRLQGIVRIEALGDDGIVGWVKGSRPADWVKEPLRGEWAVDPLVIDASFQLGGYWAWVKQQRAGFPLGVGRFVQLRPFGAGPVKCTVTFSDAKEDVFSGTLVWQNEAGEVLAVMTGAEAEFKKRDPQFQASPPQTRSAGEGAGGGVTQQAQAPHPASGRPLPAAQGEVATEETTAPVTLDESAWNPAKFPEYEALQERLQMAEAFGLQNPYFSVHEAICGDTTVVGGKEMINFSSYNYVGNSGDPVVSKAATDAILKYGTSVSASRVASGEKPLTRELELALAKFFGTEDCIVLVSGHATNVTVIGHVVGAGDLIVHDALAHDSIIQGAKLSGAKRRPFPHNDFEALDRMLSSLRPHYRRVLVCIEGTYSMDGDIPDLPRAIEVKKKHKAMLLVDEAHSAGVVGPTGRGVGEYFGVDRADVDLWMGTLSKSFASCGGYIAGTHALVEYLKYTTPGFVYSVGISPPNAAAALAATHQLLAHPERVKKAQDNARLFLKLLKERGISTGLSKDTAVVPAIIGNSVLCLQLSDALKRRGINVQPIIYPAVEDDLARLRFFLSSLHKEEQLKKTADVLKEELDRLTRELSGDAVA